MIAMVTVQSTGVRIDLASGDDLPSPTTPEERAERAESKRGKLVFVTVSAFVEFIDSDGPQRWMGTPQGPYAISLGADATSLLLELADRPDDLLPDLGIAGLHVPRFEFYAAPRRIELEESLRKRLLLR